MGGCPSYLDEKTGQMGPILKPLIEDYFTSKNLVTPQWVQTQDLARSSDLESILGTLTDVVAGTTTQSATTKQNAMSLKKSQAKFLVDTHQEIAKDSQNLLKMNGGIAQNQEYAVPTCANAPAMMCYFPTSADDHFASSFQAPADHASSGLCTFSRPLKTDTIRVLDGTFVNKLRVDTINGTCQYNAEVSPELQHQCTCVPKDKCQLACTCGTDPTQTLDLKQALQGFTTDTCLVTEQAGTLQCTPAFKCPGKNTFQACDAGAGASTCTQFSLCLDDAAISPPSTPTPQDA